MTRKINDLTNQKFGKLEVKKFLERSKRNNKYPATYWLCRCDCGNYTEATTHMLMHYKSGSGHGKYSCGCAKVENGKKLHTYPNPSIHLTGTDSLTYKGYKDISLRYYNSLKSGALSRNIIFTITMEDMWNIFEKQNGLCKLSGIQIKLCPSRRLMRENINNQTASLDRIDNSKGYTKDNIQWVHKDINFMKGKFQEEDFIKYVKLIYQYQYTKGNINDKQ